MICDSDGDSEHSATPDEDEKYPTNPATEVHENEWGVGTSNQQIDSNVIGNPHLMLQLKIRNGMIQGRAKVASNHAQAESNARP
jgi:hypothetical protein